MASFKKILFPIVILAVGGVATAVVIKTKKTPEVVIPEDLGALVEVVPAKSETSEVRVHAFGTVVAAQEITLMPELSSRIVWKNPKLELGGRIKKGEQLIRLDASDYQLAVAQ